VSVNAEDGALVVKLIGPGDGKFLTHRQRYSWRNCSSSA
jgi:hypothetical protein